VAVKVIELTKNQFDLVVARQTAVNYAQDEVAKAQKLANIEQASLSQVILAIALDNGAGPDDVFVSNQTRRADGKYVLELTQQSEQRQISPNRGSRPVETIREA
jgi:hypothetical protein